MPLQQCEMPGCVVVKRYLVLVSSPAHFAQEHNSDSGLGRELGARSLRRAGHAVLAGPGKPHVLYS